MGLGRLATDHGLALEVHSLFPLLRDGTAVETPLVDRSAGNGIRFPKAYVAAPACLPDR